MIWPPLSSGVISVALLAGEPAEALAPGIQPERQAGEATNSGEVRQSLNAPLRELRTAGLRWNHKAEADFEAMFASDILLTQGTIGYGQSRGPTEWTLSYAHNTFDLDYRPAPFDFLGFDRSVSENRNALQAGLKQRLFAPLTLLGAGGFYDGFADYRSAWLNEYYRQHFSALPEYQEAQPNGQNVSAGLRWEYLPATGFFQAEAGFLKNKIVDHYRKAGRESSFTDLEFLSDEQQERFNPDGPFRDAWIHELGPIEWTPNPGADLDNAEFWKTFHDCAAKLPVKVSRVFLLREMDEVSTDEICALLNITPNNLWVMLHRARMALRRCLEANWFGRRGGKT
ncbi:MAG: hypothetical protein FJ398_15590 [Verrucomicrobia bacterium]|nr:hypothetical protein [Verrucomicrobiota bacterium]